MFFNDFLRFLNINTHSSTSLFGREVLGRTGGAGIGFSFPGQIFLTFGWIGLLFFGFVLYLILNFFRVKNNSSIDIYLYISIVFSFAYSLRADFANLLAGIFKIGIVPLLLVKIIEKIFYKKIFDKSKFLP
jgi:hypothetical protein